MLPRPMKSIAMSEKTKRGHLRTPLWLIGLSKVSRCDKIAETCIFCLYFERLKSSLHFVYFFVAILDKVWERIQTFQGIKKTAISRLVHDVRQTDTSSILLTLGRPLKVKTSPCEAH